MDPRLAGFALIVLGSYAIQTVTGFGSTLLLVTIGAHLMPIRDIVVLAVPISVMQSVYIVVRHRDGVQWKLLLTRVLPLMLGGMAIGFFAFRGVDAEWMQTAFSILVLVLALREMWTMARAKDDAEAQPKPIHPAAGITGMLAAGVIHGLYATGGPLLVYSLGRTGLPKHAFRSTLGVVWLLLDLTLTTGFAIDSRYDEQVLWQLAMVAPAMPIGVFIGEKLHDRVDEKRFRYLVFALLIAGAASLLLR